METNGAPEPSEGKSDTGEVSVKGLTQSWMKWSSDHQEYQKHNPFSNEKAPVVQLQLGQDGYGRPVEGSKTQQRGQDAHSHVSKEVQELCKIIREIGVRQEDGKPVVRFGVLFEYYVSVSNKVVGVLLRARRQGLVHFEGEMLWQGRDDQVLISLVQ
ncbi:actin-binding Rho-activating protein-like [Hoplias malabaricus]|uniref:actin-binding Rho-activating protein-like n=1 Tax=Hoplias malabaricus TaxID=27720 RepID=UPI0034632EE3